MVGGDASKQGQSISMVPMNSCHVGESATIKQDSIDLPIRVLRADHPPPNDWIFTAELRRTRKAEAMDNKARHSAVQLGVKASAADAKNFDGIRSGIVPQNGPRIPGHAVPTLPASAVPSLPAPFPVFFLKSDGSFTFLFSGAMSASALAPVVSAPDPAILRRQQGLEAQCKEQLAMLTDLREQIRLQALDARQQREQHEVKLSSLEQRLDKERKFRKARKARERGETRIDPAPGSHYQRGLGQFGAT